MGAFDLGDFIFEGCGNRFLGQLHPLRLDPCTAHSQIHVHEAAQCILGQKPPWECVSPQSTTVDSEPSPSAASSEDLVRSHDDGKQNIELPRITSC